MKQKNRLITNLENTLAKMHNRRYCVLVARGTIAIYLALKALGWKRGKVVVPSLICLGPVNAIIYSGFEPLFCDVSREDFNLDIDKLEKILVKEKGVKAVLLPHIFGQPTDLDKVIKITQKYNVVLIEDAAQALGGKYKTKPLGSFGEFSILSFGHTKIIDVEGLGAILFNNKKYLTIIKKTLKELPKRVKQYGHLENQYRKIYYLLANEVRHDSFLARLYYSFPYIYKDLYLYKNIDIKQAVKISNNLPKLPTIIKKRNNNANYYRKLLQHTKIIHPQYRWNGVYWRYSFLIKNKDQKHISEKIRNEGINISNWYPPVHLMYSLKPKRLKNAEYVSSHIYNLWVNEKYNRQDIKKISEIIVKVLNQYK